MTTPRLSEHAERAALKVVRKATDTDDDEQRQRDAFDLLTAPLRLPAGYIVPAPYVVGVDGVNDTARGRVTSAPLLLTNTFVDPEGCRMVELAWVDRGRWLRRIVPRSAMVSGKTLVTALADVGLPVIASGAGQAERYLAALESANRDVLAPVEVARWLGWQADGTFVTAQGQPRRVEPTYPEQRTWLSAHHTTGTLSGWQDAVRPLAAYPVAQMVLVSGLTPVLLRDLHLDSHTIDVSGRSTRGKSTSAKAALSHWADPAEEGDGVFSWKTGHIDIEKRLNLVRGLPVLIDETRVAPKGDFVDQVLYQVAKNRGKARGGGWPSMLPWQTVVISTGEQSALSFTTHQGAAARVLSVTQAPIPLTESSYSDVKAIEAGLHVHYGHSGPAFVDHYRRAVDSPDSCEELRARHAMLTEQLRGGNDIASRRAPLLAAHVLAGQLAHEFGVLPFAPPPLDAWLDAFQTDDQTDDRGEMALDVVREWVASNGAALWRPKTHTLQPAAGWIGRHYTHNDLDTVALLPNRLAEALQRAGYVLDAVLPAWKENGVLLRTERRPGTGAAGDRNPYLPVRQCGDAKTRMYVFAPGRIGMDSDDEE